MIHSGHFTRQSDWQSEMVSTSTYVAGNHTSLNQRLITSTAFKWLAAHKLCLTASEGRPGGGFALPERIFVCMLILKCIALVFLSHGSWEWPTRMGISHSLPVYCKLPCHRRARARVCGLEGGGGGAWAGRWGKGGILISCEEREKRPQLTLWPVISTFTAALLCIWLCLREPAIVCSVGWICEHRFAGSHRSRRSSFANVSEARLVAGRRFSFSPLDRPKDFLFVCSQGWDLLFSSLDFQPRSWLDIVWPLWREARWMGGICWEIISMNLAVQ